MTDLFKYYERELKDFIDEALVTKDTLLKRVVSIANETLISDLREQGITLDGIWLHTMDNSAVRHTIRSHGSPKEVLRGQVPITHQDLMHIPQIISSYDCLFTQKNKRGQDVIVYRKSTENCILFYIEEIRRGRHELASATLYKREKG